MKLLLVGIFLTLCSFNAISQTIFNPGSGDSTFPVTNFSLEDNEGFQGRIGAGTTSIQGIAKSGTKYFLIGGFTNLVYDHGSSLVVDTLSGTIQNEQKWRVNGKVYTSIPDGQGGFFIGGDFTKIGDSSRKYIAQVNALGQPTGFKPPADSTVKLLYKRNDTLFIGGAFRKFAGLTRHGFAMFSISGNFLCANGGQQNFSLLSSINSFIIQGDTLIYGGEPTSFGVKPIRKYNFRNNVHSSWVPGTLEMTDIDHLQLSPDGSIIIFSFAGSGSIKGISNYLGTPVYSINLSMNESVNPTSGTALTIKVYGDKGYAAGYFNQVLPSAGSTVLRKGFFSFNPRTGIIYSDDAKLDWYCTYLEAKEGKLFISGKFTKVNNIHREHFAVMDTGTLTLSNWELSPSDALTTMAFSGSKVYVAGDFRGLYSVHRNGFAAIDSVTKEILPWNPTAPDISGSCRMTVKGDSLFVFGWRVSNIGFCIPYAQTTLRIYSLSTGVEYLLPSTMNSLIIDDCVVDGNYLYVSANRALRRYKLPELIVEPSWGWNWGLDNNKHYPSFIIVDTNRIITVGDTRYEYVCNNFGPKRAYLAVYNKTNGQKTAIYTYEGPNNQYTQPKMKEAVLAGNKVYVQGEFGHLNGLVRSNFACLDIATGAVTAWQVNIATDSTSFPRTSKLQHYSGKIWFGSEYRPLNDGSIFPGFAGIDTLTGAVYFPLPVKSYKNGFKTVHDYLLTDHEISLVGSFDSVLSKPFKNFMHQKLSGSNFTITACNGNNISINSSIFGTSYQWQVNSGSGFVNVVAGSNYNSINGPTLQIINLTTTFTGYQYRCLVDNNNGIAYTIFVSPSLPVPVISTSGNTSFCQGLSTVLTSSYGSAYQWYRDGIALNGASGFNYSAAQSGNYTVRVTIGDCEANSAPILITVNAAPATPNITASGTLICPSGVVTLTSSASSGNQWLRNGNAITNATNNSFVTTSAGNYEVRTTQNGCTSANSTAISLTNALLPSITVSYNGCSTSSLQFTASIANQGTAATIDWYRNNVLSATGTSFNLNNAVNGDQVFAKLTSTTACANPSVVNSSTVTINCITTAVSEIEGLENLQLFPNPTEGLLHINLKLTSTRQIQFQIRDQWGRLILSQGSLVRAGNHSLPFNLQSQAQGIYYLQISMNNKTVVKKLIISR